MPGDARENVARQQAALVEALASPGSGPLAYGLDARQIWIAAAAVAAKRSHSVERAWPELADALGDQFPPLFWRYAHAHRLPRASEPPDHQRFFQFVLRQADLPGEIWQRLLLLQVRRAVPVRFRLTRRGLILAVWCGRCSFAYQIAFRWPPSRVRSWCQGRTRKAATRTTPPPAGAFGVSRGSG